MPIDAPAVLQRLARDKPKFHYAEGEGIKRSAELGYIIPEGDFSMAVTPAVLRWIAAHVRQDMVTLETGAGHTTVVFAALGRHHHSFTFMPLEVQKITAYLRSLDIAEDKVTFHMGSTDRTLPNLDIGKVIDFAYIDGCHGYPFPALDWHYIDQHLKVGGILGMDNAELRPVREHCEFLEENGSYRLLHVIRDNYFVRLYEKVVDSKREWVYQPYSIAKKDPADFRFQTRVKRKVSRWIKPHLF